MEDPWASGSAWGEAPKAVTQSMPPLPSSPRPETSDPWGAVTPDTQATPDGLTEIGWSRSTTRVADDSPQAETPSWGGGWGGEAEAGPSRSPTRRPADSPDWNPTKGREEGFDDSSRALSSLDHKQTLVLPTELQVVDPPSPSGAFAPDSPYSSPEHAIPHLHDLDKPSQPTSPTFGDDFGGFSSFGDDPWGPKSQEGGWAGSSGNESITVDGHTGDTDNGGGWGGDQGDRDHQETPASPSGISDEWDAGQTPPREASDPQQDSWGGEISADEPINQRASQAGMDQEWEEAQRRIRTTEQRAPREKIVHLQDGWRDVVRSVVGENDLVDRAEIDETAYKQALRTQEDGTYETLRSLSTIPPDINTYPPVLSSMETHERYRYALTRPNPNPETSLLNVSLARRARQTESLPDSLESWTSRSRLGEPEPLAVDTSSQAEDPKPKWSFWRKNTAEKPLVTSGGGILEVKSTSNASTPVQMEPRPPISSLASVKVTGSSSRPASPAPPVPSISSPAAEVLPDIPPSVTSPDPIVPAQSAVTRFFGRLSRRQTSQPNPSEEEDQDFALSADDFSFLDQVPSITSPSHDQNVGDLLAFEGGRTESMASLESMLNSKPTPLPAALAPPPPWSGRSSTAGNAKQLIKPVDLLEGLDFGDDIVPQSPSSQATGGSTLAGDWDQLLASSAPSSTNTSVPTSAVPMIASPPAAGPSSQAHTTKESLPPTCTSDFDHFDDFSSAVAPPKMDEFDDFGDFSAFSTPPPPSTQPKPYLAPTSNAKPSPSPSHVKRASLDHTLTLNLMSDASAVKGKRWPAPPSPLAPQLSPPPKASNIPASFPFISPPPGGRSNSEFGDLLDGGSKTANAITQPPSRVQTPPLVPSMAMASSPMAPIRTASPLTRPSTTLGKVIQANSDQSAQPAQSGLSAQDLSFFDSL